MAFATAADIRARVADKVVREVLDTPEDGEVDDTLLAQGCEDATAELKGLLLRVPDKVRPDADTLRVHAIKVALYLLHSIHQPGKENEQIRNGYTDTVGFYEKIIDDTNANGGVPPVEVVGRAPPPVFTTRGAFRGFTDLSNVAGDDE